MKIAIDCRMIGSGGIGSYISALLPFFVKNNECLLIGSKESLNQFESQNTKIIECTVKTFSLKELLALPKYILNQINTNDVYYTPYCNIPGGIKIPVYSTIHDVVFLDVPGLAGKSGTFIRKWFYQRAYNKSKLVFTVSKFSKDRLEYHLKTKNKQTIVTYNALPQWFASTSEITEKRDYILFVGNIKKHKGLKILLEAYAQLLQKGFSEKLYIVGNAQNFRTGDDEVTKMISEFPENHIVFTGRITDQELNQTYKQAKLLIQPSFYEGFGMPPLEALMKGTNVILSDIPVFKEIYDGFPVSFFKTGDSNDLCSRIIENINKPKPENIPSKYSFEKTYNIIEKSLKEFCK